MVHSRGTDAPAEECAFHGLLSAHVHHTHQSGSCLYHITLKANIPALVTNLTVTDHIATLLILNCNLPKMVSKLNLHKLEKDLRNIDFAPVYNSADPQYGMLHIIKNVQYAI